MRGCQLLPWVVSPTSGSARAEFTDLIEADLREEQRVTLGSHCVFPIQPEPALLEESASAEMVRRW